MSQSITSLPTPTFVNDADGTDPLLVLADMVASFEASANRTLYPAQVEQLLINLYAYRETLVRVAIQQAAMQNLLAFATYPVLDYLGQLVATTRLTSLSATCTIHFTLANTLTVSYTLVAGTQVGSYDGAFVFATTAPLIIVAGSSSGSILAAATVPGASANGYLPGQVSVLIGGNALISSVTNTNTTAGGSSTESDAHYRTRIQAAPNQYTTTGPVGAYRYFALSADPTIVDVSVVTTVPGTVTLYVLVGPITQQPAASPNTAGIASTGVLNAVLAICSAQTVRPLNDTVVASAVTEVDYTVTATVMLYANASQTTVQTNVATAATVLMVNLSSTVQQDIVPSQWDAALSVYGVYGVDLTFTAAIAGGASLSPTSDGRFVLSAGQWANCTSLSLTYVIMTETLPP